MIDQKRMAAAQMTFVAGEQAVWPAGLQAYVAMMIQAETNRLEALCAEALRHQRIDRWDRLTVVYAPDTPTTVASLLEPPPPPPPPSPMQMLFGGAK